MKENKSLRVFVGGCRGSETVPSYNNPSTGDQFDTREYGGHTTSFLVEALGHPIVQSLGSGFRLVNQRLCDHFGFRNGHNPEAVGGKGTILLDHAHDDHIQGLYTQGHSLYDSKNDVAIIGPILRATKKNKGNFIDLDALALPQHCAIRDRFGPNGYVMGHALDAGQGPGTRSVVEGALTSMGGAEVYPVEREWFGALRSYTDFIPGATFRNLVDNGRGKLDVSTFLNDHFTGSISFRYNVTPAHGKPRSLVIATDCQPQHLPKDDPENARFSNEFVEFARGADALIIDVQYDEVEPHSNNNFLEKGPKNWGHSTSRIGIEAALRAGISRVYGTHHDPKSDADYLDDLERRSQRYALGRSQDASLSRPIDFHLLREADLITI